MDLSRCRKRHDRPAHSSSRDGRYSVLKDPTSHIHKRGPVMINPQTEPKADLADKIGRSVWFDLPVTQLADAMSFYEGLLGWTYQQMEDSPLSDYVMIEAVGKLIGGLRKVATISSEKSTPI